MLMDKAGWHTAGDLVVPENLSLVFLPPYSPNSIRSSGYTCISETIASRTAFCRPLVRSSTPAATLGIGCSAKPDASIPVFLSLARTGQQLIRSVLFPILRNNRNSLDVIVLAFGDITQNDTLYKIALQRGALAA